MKMQDNDTSSSDVELSDAELAPIAAGDGPAIIPTLERTPRVPNNKDLTFKDPVVRRPVGPEVGGLNRGFPRPNAADPDGPSILVSWSKSF